MPDQVLDLRGRPSPKPVVEARRAMSRDDVRSVVILLTDDACAQEVCEAAPALGWSSRVERTLEGFLRVSLRARRPTMGTLLAVRGGEPDAVQRERVAPRPRPVAHAPRPLESAPVQLQPHAPAAQAPAAAHAPAPPLSAPCVGATVLIGSDQFGRGDPGFGRDLMHDFIQSMGELPTPPRAIVLVNEGVRVAAEGEQSAIILARLAHAGVQVLACAESVAFDGLTGKVRVARLVAMSEISQVLLSAERVLRI